MRKYRLDRNGNEVPVWASKKKLVEMGKEHGRQAFENRTYPARYGNPTFDQAAREEWERLRELAPGAFESR